MVYKTVNSLGEKKFVGEIGLSYMPRILVTTFSIFNKRVAFMDITNCLFLVQK